MQKITPFLWFDKEAEEATNYYVETFKNAKILTTTKYPESIKSVPGTPPPGSVMTVEFEIESQRFIALNGGKVPGFEFSPAISFQVYCEDQAEIDHLWEKLSAVPEAEQCGWCKDKFGVSWQIVPKRLGEMMSDSDQAKVERVTAAFLPMKKLDIAVLEEAYNQ